MDGVLTIAASEHRQQLRNRQAARERMAAVLRAALAPPARPAGHQADPRLPGAPDRGQEAARSAQEAAPELGLSARAAGPRATAQDRRRGVRLGERLGPPSASASRVAGLRGPPRYGYGRAYGPAYGYRRNDSCLRDLLLLNTGCCLAEAIGCGGDSFLLAPSHAEARRPQRGPGFVDDRAAGRRRPRVPARGEPEAARGRLPLRARPARTTPSRRWRRTARGGAPG